MLIRSSHFPASDLDRFRDLQRRSFAILEQTAAELEAGETERQVGARLVRRYRDAGATGFFHLPVALFGERTALPGRWSVGHFYPRDRGLQPDESVILDASPLFGGYMVDTSYSFCFGRDPRHRQMMSDLSRFRADVLAAVEERRSFKDIALQVAADIEARGYEPVHQKHPGQVLGHRALKTLELPFTWRIQGFDGLSLGWFIMKGAAVRRGLGRVAPTWNHHSTSDHPPADGLWLVEPHAGCGPVGAKWEEILVIQDGEAWWLDDTPPHVRQWQRIEAGLDYAPEDRDDSGRLPGAPESD